MSERTRSLEPSLRACVRFTGCPDRFPVVWCPIPSPNRTPIFFDGATYVPGPMWTFLSALR